jgi:hypothetical protein
MTRDHYHRTAGGSYDLRIEDIRKATVNGRKVKLFKVFRWMPLANAFVFDGEYSLPQRTANKNIGFVFLRDGAYRECHV